MHIAYYPLESVAPGSRCEHVDTSKTKIGLKVLSKTIQTLVMPGTHIQSIFHKPCWHCISDRGSKHCDNLWRQKISGIKDVTLETQGQ